jgi:hypothetical protein
MTARARLATVAALWATAWAGCAGDRARSPTCGIAQLAGPALIQQQLFNLSYVLTEAPRGLPASLPARVVYVGEGPKPAQSEVSIAYANNRLVMGYQGTGFPAAPGGYGLLVVDDSTRRAQGVLMYESQVPRNYPELGTVTSADRSIPLFGVRVNWAGVSNTRCPLLGDAAPAATPK